MKVFSSQFWFFLLGVLVLTFLFRIGLSYFLDQYNPVLIFIVSVAYGLGMALNGFLWGKADGQKNAFFDIGLRWNLGAMILWALVSFLWIYSGYASEHEYPVQVLRALLIWGIFAIAHIIVFLFVRRHSIKGIHKGDLFD